MQSIKQSVIKKEKVVPIRNVKTNGSSPSRRLDLCSMENIEQAIKRIYAWYECQIIDRPPVKFAAHNANYNISNAEHHSPEDWKRIKFDAERIVDGFIRSIDNRRFLGETFPFYFPDIGPDVYAAFYGCELTYAETTAWSHPLIKSWQDIDKLKLDMTNEYFRKIEELTIHAIERSHGRYWVGYTDLHPGLDCVLAWRGMEQLCFDLIDEPEQVEKMVKIAAGDFCTVYDHFDKILKSHHQPSITWMGIPSFETFHVPSCDFATMMSPEQFNRFALPAIINEIRHTKHNVFHLDGKGVARHLDVLLELPEINAIQWVQGVGDDLPIMQWIELIKRIQKAGKGVIVDLQKSELEDFIEQVRPEGIFLWIAEDDESEQRNIIKRLEKW